MKLSDLIVLLHSYSKNFDEVIAAMRKWETENNNPDGEKIEHVVTNRMIYLSNNKSARVEIFYDVMLVAVRNPITGEFSNTKHKINKKDIKKLESDVNFVMGKLFGL